MSDDNVDCLPPAQYLMLEVLAARFRMGETRWPFPASCKPVARRLVLLGLISVENGSVPRWFDVSLTEKGIQGMHLHQPRKRPPRDRPGIGDVLQSALVRAGNDTISEGNVMVNQRGYHPGHVEVIARSVVGQAMADAARRVRIGLETGELVRPYS